MKLCNIWKNSERQRWRQSSGREYRGNMYQWADISNVWWGGRKTPSSIRLRIGTLETFFSFFLFKNLLETSSEEDGPIKYYRTKNSLENQMEAVSQGVCQETNGNQGGKLWQGVEVLEETSNMCLEPLPSNIWHLRLKCSRECQLLLSTGSEI